MVYHFHANVERQQRLSGQIGKNLTLLEHEDMLLNSTNQTRKNRAPLS